MTSAPLRLLASSLLLAAAACGGAPPPHKKPVAKPAVKAPVVKPETEEDRVAKRHTAAVAIVPEGSSCLPAALREDHAPRLELAQVGTDAMICAIDTDASRLLGPVGCWKIDLAAGALTYQAPAPLPGHGFDVKLDGGCARGFCLPKDAPPTADAIAHVAWSPDGAKVAVLVGSTVHLFDAASKAHDKAFPINGDKGVGNEPFALHLVGDRLFVEGQDAGPFSAVWQFQLDGTPVGRVDDLGAKTPTAVSTYQGSFSILDKSRVAVAWQGFSALTVVELDGNKRSKLVRKLPKLPCKPAELEGFWLSSGGELAPKCKEALDLNFNALIGAQVLAGSKNFLAVLRGSRVGELAVLDAKTLAEKKAIKLPWCDAAK
jgi:hypothetical protein